MAKSKRNGGGVIEYVHPDGDTTFRIQYRDASGKQVKETLGRSSEGWNRTRAKDERKKRIGRVADGYRRPESVSFSDYAEIWFERRQVFKSYAPATISSYRTTINRLKKEFGSERLRDLTTLRVNAFLTKLLEGYGPGLANRAVTVLGMILDAAVLDGVIDEAKRPKPSRATLPDFCPRPLSAPEARAIEAKLALNDNPQVRLIFLTIELLGIRRKELLGLRWRDLDVEGKRVRIVESKTAAGHRSMYVPGFLLELLIQHRATAVYAGDANYIFSSRTGNKFNVNTYYNAFHKAVDELGLTGIRPFHELRATFLTEGAKDGVSPAILMAQAGHRDFSTTKRYIEFAGVVFEDEGERLAERRMGDLRLVEGGEAQEAALVQEAVS